MYYFAYGSNLERRRMFKRCPHAQLVANAKLTGYRLVFAGYSLRWRGGVATIVRAKGEIVWGVVYDIDPDCFRRLDRIEGVGQGRYQRRRVQVVFGNGRTRLVSTYVRQTAALRPPSRIYKKVLQNGLQEHDLPITFA